MRSAIKTGDDDADRDFNSYPDREVLYFGIPYCGAKHINNVWYQRTLDGGYRRFPFQQKVQEVVSSEMENREEKPKTDVPPKTRKATD